jgi:hypothetical protein
VDSAERDDCEQKGRFLIKSSTENVEVRSLSLCIDLEGVGDQR